MIKSVDDAPRPLADGIREFWPEFEWDNAASIAWLESGFKWYAVMDSTDAAHPCGAVLPSQGGITVTAEVSIGFFQINWCNFPDWDPWRLMDPRENAGTAHMLWDNAGQSWAPWYFSARKLGLL